MPLPPDPFRNTDPLWQPYQLPADEKFSMPDHTPSTIKNFLRETARSAARQLRNDKPAKPAPFEGAPINIPKGY
jgi:hypothetical protein